MAGPGGGPPKILLAKPSAGPLPAKFGRSVSDDEPGLHRSRLPPAGSLNLLSESWDFHIDRILPFLTENTDFTVVGVIGNTGVGKSTILNEIYGFDGSSAGMLPPFAVESEEIRAMAKHCTTGIEPRISAERFILLDTQPVFCPSILAEMIRPDGSSTIPILGEVLPAELAHELMSIQLGVLLASICHVLLVVSEGVHDDSMWHLMSTVDLLKHGIPDPSSAMPSPSQTSSLGMDKECNVKGHETENYMAIPIFVHTKLWDRDFSPQNVTQLKKAVSQYFRSHSFARQRPGDHTKGHVHSPGSSSEATSELNCFVIPSKNSTAEAQHESYMSAMSKLRDQVLSMKCASFSRTVSEREWLKNSAKIWEKVKSSPIIAEYSKMLQNSGMFKR